MTISWVLAESSRMRYAAGSSMYFAQGIPQGLLGITIPAWLASQGVSASDIGSYLAVIVLPWAFKLVTGPFMDRFQFRPMGKRRPWVLAAQLGLSISLLVGAMGMVLTGVLNIDEAYESVSWKTVFLLASLIPLGLAMERTSTAAWIAQEIMAVLGDVPELAIQVALAVLATVFSLVMSNVGATTILVPIAVSIALATGASPTMYALIVALSTSNAFILPTHQVNALVMRPGGYRTVDYTKAGAVMTVLFLTVELTVIYFFYGISG